MAIKALPPQSVLLQLLTYDEETGILMWRERGPEWFTSKRAQCSWNGHYAGKPALHNVHVTGYRQGYLLAISAKSHRVIWKMKTGEEADQIDHINGDRTDNRWINLRSVDQTGNQRNAARRKDNASGHTGVTWYPHQKTGKWLVKIGNKHVGLYEDLNEAIAARQAAEREYGYHVNHGRAAKGA